MLNILKKKYIVMFMIKEREVYNVLKIKRINPLDKEVYYLDNTYIIDTSKQTYSKVLKNFFLIDVDKEVECQLFFNNTKKDNNNITPNDVDMVIEREIVKQLTTNLSDTTFKMNLMYILFGAGFGGLLGYIIGGI